MTRMTNGEMIQKVFDCEVCEPLPEDDIIHVIFPDKNDSAIGFDWSWWNMEYKDPTAKNNLGVDCISRESIKQKLQEHHDFFVNAYGGFSNLPQNDKSRVDEITNCIAMVVNEPPVTLQEPRKGHCKDCKWWKDGDGKYRRGCGAESKCPINTKTVYLGNGYCYKFEPQESEG